MSNYADVDYGDAYFALRLRSQAWDDATDDDKVKALTEATDIIDQLNFAGDKTDSDQENQFPRSGDSDIPDAIKQAACEIAKALLDGVDPEKEFENLFKLSTSYGGVRTSFDRTSVAGHTVSGVPSFKAWKLLFPYLRDPAQIRIQRVD